MTNGPTLREPLQVDHGYGKIDTRRKLEIFSQIARHLNALVYLIAELVTGVKPEKL